MKYKFRGESIHIATGGRAFDSSGKVITLIHGSGQNHLTWILQSRYLAHRGFSVLAPDFPGHGLSSGEPLKSIEAQAEWIIELLASLSVSQYSLVGHSQGALVSLETASLVSKKIQSICLIAGAMSIPVSDDLIDASEKALQKAVNLMTSWGHGSGAHMYDNTMPGHSFLEYGRRIMASNNRKALLTDLTACNNYKNGKYAASQIYQPTLCILAEEDKMTPIKFGKAMAKQIKNSGVIVIEKAGHILPAEKPLEVNKALHSFLHGSLG